MALPTLTTVTKNAGRFTMALVIQRLIALAYFTLAARWLGPHLLGGYVMAVNLAMAAGALADLGLANVVTREAAKQPAQTTRLLGLAMSVKVILIIVAYAVLQLAAAVSPTSPEVKILLWGTGLVMVVDAFTVLVYAVVRAQHRLHLEGRGSIITQLAVAAVGVPLLLLNPTAVIMVGALLVGSLVNLWYSVQLVRGSGVEFTVRYKKEEWVWLWRIMWPFAASLVLTRLYGYVDGIVVGWFRGAAAVGYYGVPAKIITSLQFVPLAFVAALYPALAASYGQNNRQSLQELFYQSVRYMWFIGLLAAVLIGSLAGPFLIAVFGQAYAASIPVLQILALQLPLLFISFPFGSLLNACDRQRYTTIAMATALTVDIILLVLLLPPLGIIGAAAASVAATAAMVAVQLVSARRLAWSDTWLFVSKLVLNLTIAVMTAIIMLVLLRFLPWLVVAGAGVAVFVGLGKYLGVVQTKDLRQIMGILKRE